MFAKIKRWLIARAEKVVPSLRLWVLQIVLEAENRIPGESGSDKRAYVIKALDELIRLPVWLEPFDGMIFGALVDLICSRLNARYGHIWGDVVSKDVMPVVSEEVRPDELG
ncbi:MAG: hypothetical protein K6E42_02335 [Synergistes sp.]|nr:hypothetical protein [Synergistes sp.]